MEKNTQQNHQTVHGITDLSLLGIPSTGARLGKASTSDVRKRNRSIILRTLFPRNCLSRADIARKTHLTKVGVSDVVADLIDEGLLMEVGQKASTTRGKRGTVLRLDSDARNIVVIDTSQQGTILGAVTNLLGEIIYREELPLDDPTQFSVQTLVDLCKHLCTVPQVPILGIGVAFQGTVSNSGIVVNSTAYEWSHVDLASILTQETGLPIHVSNDANAAAFAESLFGASEGDFIFIYMSRGLGSAAILGGRILIGSNSAAGELGHVVIDPKGELCQCGKHGCLETLISATALEKRIKEKPEQKKEIFEWAGRTLSTALSFVVGMLDAPTIVVYCQPNIIDETFLNSFEEELNALITTADREPVQVKRASVGRDIVILGESASLLRSQLGI